MTDGLTHDNSVELTKVAGEFPKLPNMHVRYSVEMKDLPMMEISVPPLTLPLEGLEYKISIAF